MTLPSPVSSGIFPEVNDVENPDFGTVVGPSVPSSWMLTSPLYVSSSSAISNHTLVRSCLPLVTNSSSFDGLLVIIAIPVGFPPTGTTRITSPAA